MVLSATQVATAETLALLDDADPSRVVFFCSTACQARSAAGGKGGRANAPKKPSYVMSIKFDTLTAG
jgi:hypothetical protein